MIQVNQVVTILRDCNAIAIPAGIAVILHKNRSVQITQALGGSFTVNDHGSLLRIAAADADALGEQQTPIKKEQAKGNHPHTVSIDQIKQQLATCYDPEIPVNIVELGLIYEIGCYQLADNDQEVRITMTLTAPGCGMGDVLAEEIQQKVLTIPGIDRVKIDIVYDPPWDQGMMSDAAKLQFGML